MNLKTIITAALIYTLSHSVWADSSTKETPSKRIEVYSLSQSYWDTKYGDTLGEIAQQLLPYNKNKQQQLIINIIELNPNAFVKNKPATMKANLRLWLPNNMSHVGKHVDPSHYNVQSFSWGNIKRPKR
jgi:hypothetical protein